MNDYDKYKSEMYENPTEEIPMGYYRTVFYLGYRPFMGWLIAFAVALLFPIQLILILLASLGIVTVDLLTYKPLVDAISIPIVSLAGTIIGFRTYEKVKGL